jgi:DNA-binding NarL/FixJ family response regulator
MKTPRRKIIHVSVLESDPVRIVGLQAVFKGESDIKLRVGTVETVLHGREDELVLMTTDRGPTFSSAMSALKAIRPGIRIIVTGPGRRDDDILRAVSAGAKGYVAEEASSDALKKAIREVHAGSVWVPRRVLAAFIERTTPHHVQPQAPMRSAPKISEREREVLRLLVDGYSNRQIAYELGIIEGTVKAHIVQLMRKTGAPNRIALTVHALSKSLLQGQRASS